jgi:hypothetical protein
MQVDVSAILVRLNVLCHGSICVVVPYCLFLLIAFIATRQ